MGVNGDYAEGGLDVSLGHKSTLPEGKEEMDGIVNSDVLILVGEVLGYER